MQPGGDACSVTSVTHTVEFCTVHASSIGVHRRPQDVVYPKNLNVMSHFVYFQPEGLRSGLDVHTGELDRTEPLGRSK
jgi:hypothetical protein